MEGRTAQEPESAVQARASREHHLSRAEQLSAITGVYTVVLTGLAYLYVPAPTSHFKRISDDGLYAQAFLRLDVILAGVFLSALLLTPVFQVCIDRLRPKWRAAHTRCALAATCAFLWYFVIHFGRWQFGAYDFNILIETGWRQILGQRPYVDFPATTPPGFNLGCKFAFQLFGVNWDANLYWAAIFGCTTFLWMYWLLRRLSTGRLASAGVAFAIECAAMLTVCFWWYNNGALISGTVFFLSCLAYFKQPRSLGVQTSYFISLILLSLMKPNIAGLTIFGCVLLLLLTAELRIRLIGLTIGATAVAIAFLLANHVPIGKMLTSYLSVAKQHGGIHSQYEFRMLSLFEQHSAEFWLYVLSVPLLGMLPSWTREILGKNWRSASVVLFFLLAPLIAVYGLLTNGEFRDADYAVVLATGGVIVFGLRWNGALFRRVYIAVLCASIAGDLYYGAMRIRVYTIGPSVFFEWHDNRHTVDSGFLKNMRVGGPMIKVESEIAQAMKANPAPYFFGPRIDFNYAVFGIKSPEQFPAWWHPGTAFPLSEESKILNQWHEDQFATLIFVKPGFAGYGPGMFYTYYPQVLMDEIAHQYSADETYPDIVVYHRRQ